VHRPVKSSTAIKKIILVQATERPLLSPEIVYVVVPVAFSSRMVVAKGQFLHLVGRLDKACF
jgi:hypothetical protein